MIPKLGASWWIASENDCEILKEFAIGYDANVQVSFYTRELAEEWLPNLLDIPKGKVGSIHLPKGLLPVDYEKGGLVDTLVEAFDVQSVVVHPWCVELPEIVSIVQERKKYVLNLEVFAWKDLNGKASPFTLIEKFGNAMREDWIGLCMDSSHLVPELITFSFFKALIPYTKMYHLSGKLGDKQHMPITKKELDAPIQTIISRLLDLKVVPPVWILEYMPEYYNDLKKNYFWLRDLITSKRRKYGDI